MCYLQWKVDGSPSRRECLNFFPTIFAIYDGKCWRIDEPILSHEEFDSLDELDFTLASIINEHLQAERTNGNAV